MQGDGRHRRQAPDPRSRTPPPTSTQMVALIADLVERGRRLRDQRRRLLHAPSRSPTTGCWPASRSRRLQAGARVEVNDEKRSPIDFALWKKAKPGEPSWPSPWGDGRPGWHTECVVMALDLLGEGFDLHGGGQDLAFPHHENERAQAVGRRAATFARHWMHNGFVEVGGEKMSKSLGNFTNLLDLIELDRPARLPAAGACAAHYRSPIEVNQANAEDAVGRRCASSTSSPAGPAELPPVEPDAEALERVPAADGRRPQHPRRGRPAVHAGAHRQQGHGHRRRRDGRPGSPPRWPRSARPSGSSSRAPTCAPSPTTCWPWPPSATPPAATVTGAAPTTLRQQLQERATSSRTAPPAPSSAAALTRHSDRAGRVAERTHRCGRPR